MSPVLAVKVTPDERAAYSDAARACGMSRHRWMRLVLNVACGRSEAGMHLARLRELPKP